MPDERYPTIEGPDALVETERCNVDYLQYAADAQQQAAWSDDEVMEHVRTLRDEVEEHAKTWWRR